MLMSVDGDKARFKHRESRDYLTLSPGGQITIPRGGDFQGGNFPPIVIGNPRRNPKPRTTQERAMLMYRAMLRQEAHTDATPRNHTDRSAEWGRRLDRAHETRLKIAALNSQMGRGMATTSTEYAKWEKDRGLEPAGRRNPGPRNASGHPLITGRLYHTPTRWSAASRFQATPHRQDFADGSWFVPDALEAADLRALVDEARRLTPRMSAKDKAAQHRAAVEREERAESMKWQAWQNSRTENPRRNPSALATLRSLKTGDRFAPTFDDGRTGNVYVVTKSSLYNEVRAENTVNGSLAVLDEDSGGVSLRGGGRTQGVTAIRVVRYADEPRRNPTIRPTGSYADQDRQESAVLARLRAVHDRIVAAGTAPGTAAKLATLLQHAQHYAFGLPKLRAEEAKYKAAARDAEAMAAQFPGVRWPKANPDNARKEREMTAGLSPAQLGYLLQVHKITLPRGASMYDAACLVHDEIERKEAARSGPKRNPFPAQIGGSENIPEGHAVGYPGVKPMARIRAAISRIDRATNRTEVYRAYHQAMRVMDDLQRRGVHIDPELFYAIPDSYTAKLRSVPLTDDEREQDARDAAYKTNMKAAVKKSRYAGTRMAIVHNPSEMERAYGATDRPLTSRMKAANYRKAARALDKMAANSERELSPTHATVVSIRAEAADWRRKADLLDKLGAKRKNPARRRKKTGAKRKAFQAQSILLDKDTFTLARAREWLKKNGKKYGKITEGDADWHAEQHPASDYQPTRKGGYGGFHTIQLGKHVQAVVGIPQRGSDAAEATGYNTKGPGLFGNRKASGPAMVADYNAEDVLY
jgi:hypothetical protein